MMNYMYSLVMAYFLLCLYALLSELPRSRSSWTFIALFSIAFPVLLIVHFRSEWRAYRRRKQQQETGNDF